MEGPTSSFEYKGSIADAINASRREKKLFMVYISGQDESSIRFAESTWVDLRVAESITKCCIFLHLKQGSIEASQFSAIYPQQSAPNITAIGYNGVILWKHDGYINAEDFVENIEKAWAALHLQGATATLVAAALASKKPESSNSSSPITTPLEQGTSSSLDISSSSADEPSSARGARSSTIHGEVATKEIDEQKADVQMEEDAKPGEGTLSPSIDTLDAKANWEEQPDPSSGTGNRMHNHMATSDSSTTGNGSDGSTKTHITLDEDLVTHDTPNSAGKMPSGPVHPQGTSRMVLDEVEGKKQVNTDEFSDSKIVGKANDVHLNIRLPDGSNLQAKFSFSDSLRLVKKCVDENQTCAMGPYDLAIPYPRKVFSELDMEIALSELGFASRQALIVVPRRQITRPQRSQSSDSAVQATDSTGAGEGYFGFLKRVFSYVNPFSYIGGNSGSSSSQPAANDSSWRYSPNPALREQLAGARLPHHPYSPNSQHAPSGDNAGNMRTSKRPFGSNIHTLRHDEDEGPSGDRNTFWNGNSTEYGGNDR